MDLGLFIAASGMVAEQTRQDQLSNDLANASTPGYKPDATPQQSFGEILLRNSATGRTIGSLNTGVALGKTYTDMAPAGMQSTGEPLDFGIVGTGFFGVQTPEGTRYTRDGQFTTSAQGLLVTATGQNVLNQSGTPIKVAADGTVPASALGVFNVPGAVKQGENLFAGTAATGASGAGGSSGALGTVRQGVLEESGVNPTTAMVEMVGSLRTFQSGQQAIQAIDQTLQAAATQVGSMNGSS
ncbi:MAG TPA: flagellar hook-basal body protein [Solirubrobacteraceae bacterium]|jgi:flagellar basal-body rod protein FlgF|nr:flagellar hook-basal body protein [Solirubrobacteraceae bacterium]